MVMEESSLRVSLVEFCGAHQLDGALVIQIATDDGSNFIINFDEATRLANILMALVDQGRLQGGETMPLPHVAFSADSATGIECAVALTRSLIQGELDDEAFANPALTLRNIARVVDWIADSVTPDGVLMIQDPQGEQAMISLQDALGIQGIGIGGGIIKQLLMQKLLEMATKFITEWLERQAGGQQ